MKSQVAKRVNVNLTEKNVKGIELLQKWYEAVGGEKELKQSDIIRDAIDYYVMDMNATLKNKGQKIAKQSLEHGMLTIMDDDDLPF